MNELKHDFREMIANYRELGEEFGRILKVDDSRDPQALAKSILQNHECLSRINQMSSRVASVSDSWKRYRDQLDTESREEIDSLAETARNQAARLQELCSVHVEKLKTTSGHLQRHLTEISKGSQYLKTLKPSKNNYPKFIDSLH